MQQEGKSKCTLILLKNLLITAKWGWISWSSVLFLDGQFPQQVKNFAAYFVYYLYHSCAQRNSEWFYMLVYVSNTKQ